MSFIRNKRYPRRQYSGGYYRKHRRRMSKALIVLCIGICALFGFAFAQLAQQARLQPILEQAQAFYEEVRDRLNDLSSDSESPHVTGDYDLIGKVIEIKDGDTFILRADSSGRNVEIRLDGIDTPEWDQHWGRQAERALSKMVSRKQVAVLTSGIDTYGRTLGTLYYDGNNINLRMVAEGHAWWYRHYAENDRQLAEAEAGARNQRLGLWQDANPIPPWDWRRNRR